MSRNGKDRSTDKALNILRERQGPFRTSEVLAAGVHPRVFYGLLDTGVLERLSRGLYRLTEQEPLSDPDLIVVARRLPQAVVCLVSALSFHDLTTQIPRAVSIAIAKGATTPSLENPPLAVYRFSEQALWEGVEEHDQDGVPIKIFSAEKTLVDCFKFRNKLGINLIQEALQFYKKRKKINFPDLMHYADVCRVANVMRPYLEAFL